MLPLMDSETEFEEPVPNPPDEELPLLDDDDDHGWLPPLKNGGVPAESAK